MLATNNLCNLELFVKLTDNRSIIYKKGLYGCSQRNRICEYLRTNLRTNLRILPHASIAKHFHIKYLADISLVRNLKNLITKTVFTSNLNSQQKETGCGAAQIFFYPRIMQS